MKILNIAPTILDIIDSHYVPIGMGALRDSPPYGFYLLSGILKAAGHDVVLADLIAQGTRSITHYRSDIEDCSLVAIGATSLSWPSAVDLINQIRRIRKDAPIVLGGIHPTMFDRYILNTFPVQYIIRGEGEIALPSLCRALEWEKNLNEVPNLSWRTPKGEIIRNPIAPLITGEMLDSFALPDYSELPPNVYNSLAIESSRGCAFDCSFCSTSYRTTWRSIPAENFVNRLECIMEHLDKSINRTIHIVDDEFSMNPKRAAEIGRIIRSRGLNPRLIYDCRATDVLSDGFIDNIAEFTEFGLIGAECGYDEGLKLIGKGTTCQIIEDAARKLNEYEICGRMDFSFIIGLPWESRIDVERTIRFALTLNNTYNARILLQWYCQLPGSRLWDDAYKKQIVNETMYDNYGFFRDLYLFRTGVNLTPQEIWELVDMMAQLKLVADYYYPHQEVIRYGVPQPIITYFPRDFLSEEDTGLPSLRQVSHPELISHTNDRGFRATPQFGP